jgi:hypothetical protein
MDTPTNSQSTSTPPKVANFWSELEALAAGAAAGELVSRKVEILGWIDTNGPVAFDHIKAALEKAEPGGFKMALVASTLNKMFDGLDDEAKAALPKTAEGLFDWCVAKLTAIASVK